MENESDHAPAHANKEGGGGAIVPASKSKALTSVASLTSMFKGVVLTIGGRAGAGMPMMLFKARENNGTYVYGQKRIVPDENGIWIFNLETFKHGWICFDGKKVLGERMVPIDEPMPPEPLDAGFPWQKQGSVNMKCINGPDANVEVVFKATTDGGLQAIRGTFDTTRDRLIGGQHDSNIVPGALLRKNSYQHSEYGRVWKPVLEIVEWYPLDGPPPASAPKPPPPPPESAAASADDQPRRRRIV
jgi:hypothetical protein